MAGRIPQGFIDDLISRVDIVEVIGARLPLRKVGREYQARCPFHDEKTPSFTVSPTKQFYHCFGCGAHGTAITFLMEYEHAGFVDAVDELARLVGLSLPRPEAGAETPNHQPLYDLLTEAEAWFRARLRDNPDAVAYLKGRGLSGRTAADFSIGYAPPGWDGLLGHLGQTPAQREALIAAGLVVKKDSGACYDRFRHRIVFPIRDRRGRVIGFGGRVIGDDTPKYLNSPETALFHKGRELYGLYEAQRALGRLESVLVVEGYMDVVALAEHGIRHAVATLGTATTREHLERLFRLSSEVLFCFDGDRAGRAAAWRALEQVFPLMVEGRQARFLFFPEGDDPDSVVRREGAEGFRARIAKSVPLSTFFYETLAGQTDMNSMDGRARLVELARPLIARLPAGVFRHLMLDQLAERARVERRALRRALGSGAAFRPLPGHSGKNRPPLSPVGKAVALLLRRPDLAGAAGDPQRWCDLAVEDLNLLCALLELLQHKPHLSLGGILEQWRGKEQGERLAQLATWNEPLSDEEVETEFRAVVHWLDGRRHNERTKRLLSKAAGEGLSAEEKTELKHLLAAPPLTPA
ncbi:MAG TPA: DNA primase [Gammaproteobacteria bacterium]|nr:DNA primase [Gammaproteobacteria bacterium]